MCVCVCVCVCENSGKARVVRQRSARRVERQTRELEGLDGDLAAPLHVGRRDVRRAPREPPLAGAGLSPRPERFASCFFQSWYLGRTKVRFGRRMVFRNATDRTSSIDPSPSPRSDRVSNLTGISTGSKSALAPTSDARTISATCARDDDARDDDARVKMSGEIARALLMLYIHSSSRARNRAS